MTDVSKEKQWLPHFKTWSALLEPFGCTVQASPSAYEIAKVTGPGVSLIIYPYKTSSGDHRARIRNNNSKDKEQARRAIAATKLWCKKECHLTVYGYELATKTRDGALGHD